MKQSLTKDDLTCDRGQHSGNLAIIIWIFNRMLALTWRD